MEKPNIKNIGIIAGGIAGALILYKLADFLGLIKSKQEKQQESDEINLVTNANADSSKLNTKNGSLSLSPNYLNTIYKQVQADYKKKGKTAPKLSTFLGPYKYSELATLAYDSKGTFKDNMPQFFGVINTLQSQLQISFLSNLFFKIYGRDLLNYFLSFTNTEERAQLYAIIKNKKLY